MARIIFNLILLAICVAGLGQLPVRGEDMSTDTPDMSVELPLPVVEIDMRAEWGAWLEATYDPDNERIEDREV